MATEPYFHSGSGISLVDEISAHGLVMDLDVSESNVLIRPAPMNSVLYVETESRKRKTKT